MSVPPPSIADRAEPRAPSVDPGVGPGRHTDSYRLAQSFVLVLLLTALDVTNALDQGNRIKYAILLFPLFTMLVIRVRPGHGRLRKPAPSDRILLVLALLGLGGTLYGLAFAHTKSPSVTLFVPMLLGFFYLGVTEPMTEAEARSILRWLMLIGLVYVFLSAVVNSGLVSSLTQYRQYRNATMFFVPLGFAAALGVGARLRATVILLLALVTFAAYPSGTAALIGLTTVLTLLVTRPSGRSLRPWVVAMALLVALLFTALNFNNAVKLSGSYFSLVGKRNNDVTRVALWDKALQRFEGSPLVGNVFTGETTVTVSLPLALAPGQDRSFTAPFHSDYLLLLANGGLLGLGLLLAWAATVEVMAYRRYRAFLAAGRPSKAATIRALLIGFNAFFCAMAFNPLFNGMSVAASLFAMYGLLMLAGDPRRELVRPSRAAAGPGSGAGPSSSPGNGNGSGSGNGSAANGLRSANGIAGRSEVEPPIDLERGVTVGSGSEHLRPEPNEAERAAFAALARSIWEVPSPPAAPVPAIAAAGSDAGVEDIPSPVPAAATAGPPAAPPFASARSRLAGGSRWLLMARFCTLALGLVINALLTRLLSPHDVGAYFTTFTLVVIGSTVAELGMDRAVVRVVAAAIGRADPGRARSAIEKTLLVGSIGTFVVAAALMAGLGHVLAEDVFRSPVIAAAIPLAAGWLAGTALMQLATESLRGLQRFGLTSIFDWLLVDAITATVFGVAFVTGSRFHYSTAVLVSSSATAAAAILGLIVIARRARSLKGEGVQPLGGMLSIAWPLLVTNLGLFLVNAGVDIWILGAFRPQSDVALYGAAARIALLVAVPFTILLGTVPPLIAELHARRRRGELERMLRIMATVATVPALVACAVFVAFGGPIMARFYGGAFYAHGATVLAILSVAQLISVTLGACGVTLMMTGHQRTMMLITIPTGVASVTAAILLAPRFGGTGVAGATACGIALQNALQLVFVRRYLGVWTMARASIRPIYQFVGRDPEQRVARGR